MMSPSALGLIAALLMPSVLPDSAARTGVDTAGARQQERRPLAISVDGPAGFRPIVHVGPVLAGGELEQAAISGLPIRMRVRVELWKDRLFDQLVDSVSWSTVIVYEPIGEQFFVRSLPSPRGSLRFGSFTAAGAPSNPTTCSSCALATRAASTSPSHSRSRHWKSPIWRSSNGGSRASFSRP